MKNFLVGNKNHIFIKLICQMINGMFYLHLTEVQEAKIQIVHLTGERDTHALTNLLIIMLYNKNYLCINK